MHNSQRSERIPRSGGVAGSTFVPAVRTRRACRPGARRVGLVSALLPAQLLWIAAAASLLGAVVARAEDGSVARVEYRDPLSGQALEQFNLDAEQLMLAVSSAAGSSLDLVPAASSTIVARDPSRAAGRKTYVVQLKQPALVRLMPQGIAANGRLDPRDRESKLAHSRFLRRDPDGKMRVIGELAQTMARARESMSLERERVLGSLGLARELPPTASRLAASGGKAAVGGGERVVFDYRLTLNALALRLDDAEAAALAQHPDVAAVAVDQTVRAVLRDSVPLIGADQFRSDTGVTGAGKRIAIIDTGVDYMHPDLGGGLGASYKVAGGYDFVNRDANPMDDHGHGTHVAGTAAGNGPVLQGVASGARILAYKVLSASGSGSWSGVIAGIEAAADPDGDPDTLDGVDIISMSLGGAGSPDDPVATAVDNATGGGILSVIAAGNSGPGYGTIGSPGVAVTALTVGATDKIDSLASFSSRGPVGASAIKPDLTAPGVDICAAQWATAWNSRLCVDDEHVAISGTSMATPHVAGAAALLWELEPQLGPLEVKAWLMGSAQPLPGKGPFEVGSGRASVTRAQATTAVVTPASVDFGADDAAEPLWEVSRTLVLRNFSDAPATYSIALESALPEGLSHEIVPSIIELAPGEAAPFILTLQVDNTVVPDATSPPYAYYGAISAMPTGVGPGQAGALRVPFSFIKSPRLIIHYDEAPYATFIHDRDRQWLFISYPCKDLVVRLPGGTWDVVSLFWSNRVVVREGVLVSNVTEIPVHATEAAYQLSWTYKNESGGVVPIGRGAASFGHLPSGLKLIYLGLNNAAWRFNEVSTDYRFDWKFVSADYLMPKTYAFADFRDGIVASEAITSTAADLLLTRQVIDTEGKANQAFVLDWLSEGPKGGWSFTGYNIYEAYRAVPGSGGTIQAYRKPTPPEVTFGWEYQTGNPYRGAPFDLYSEPRIWESPYLRTPADAAGHAVMGQAVAGQDAGPVVNEGFPLLFATPQTPLFRIQNGATATGGLARHWNVSFVSSWQTIRMQAAAGKRNLFVLDGRENFRPWTGLSYRLYSEVGALIRQALLPSAGGSGYGPLSEQVALDAAGKYRIELTDSEARIAGRQAQLTVSATLDTRLGDPNPPTFSALQTAGTVASSGGPKGAPRSVFAANEVVRVGFAVADQALSSVTARLAVAYQPGEEELAVHAESATSSGGTYFMELPAGRYEGFVDLTIEATDSSGNSLRHSSRPVAYISPTPPTAPVVTDAGAFAVRRDQLTAQAYADDAESGVTSFEAALGSSAGATNIAGWRSFAATPATGPGGERRGVAELTFTGLALTDGATVFVTARAINGAGSTGPQASSDGVVVDASAPTIAYVTDPGAYTADGTKLSVNAAAADGQSGVSQWQSCVGTLPTACDLADWTVHGATASPVALQHTGLSLADGARAYVQVKARNGAGLWSAPAPSDGVVVDSSAPGAADVTVAGSFWGSTATLGFSVRAADAQSGVARYQICAGATATTCDVRNWVTVASLDPAPGADVASPQTLTGLSLVDGRLVYIRARAENGAGLVGPPGALGSLTVDATPASTPLVTDDGDYTTSLVQLHASWSSADAQSGIAEYSYCIGTGPSVCNVADWTSTSQVAAVTRGGLNLTDGGRYTFNVKARNGANTWSLVGYSNRIIVDSTPPAVPVVSDSGDFASSASGVTFTATSGDAHSGIARYRYCLGTAAGDCSVQDWQTSTSGAFGAAGLNIADYTTVVATVIAVNGAGLESGPGVSDGIVMDTHLPVAPLVTDDGAYQHARDRMHVTWTSSDDPARLSGFEVALGRTAGAADLRDWEACGKVFEKTLTGLALADGVTVFVAVRATSLGGSRGPAGATDGILVDGSPPRTVIQTHDPFTPNKTALSVTLNTADPNTPVVAFEVALGSSAGATDVLGWTRHAVTPRVGVVEQLVQLTGLSLQQGVTYYLIARAENGVGLKCDPGAATTVAVDTTPPVIQEVGDGGDYSRDTNRLQATVRAADETSGLGALELWVGTTAGAEDVLGHQAFSGDRFVNGVASVSLTGFNVQSGRRVFVTARVRNRAGLWCAPVSSDGITIDGTAASTPVVEDAGAYTTSATALTFQVSSADAESGVAGYRIAVGTAAGLADAVAWRAAQGPSISLTGLSLVNGRRFFASAIAINGAGIDSPSGVSDGITVDTTAPARPSVSLGGRFSNGSAATVTVVASDPESGIARYRIGLGTAPGLDDLVSFREVETAVTTLTGLGLSDGRQYYATATVRNGAGSWSEPGTSGACTADSRAPAKPVVAADRRISTDGEIGASYSSSDASGSVLRFDVAVGTAKDVADVLVWRAAPSSGAVLLGDLALVDGTRYLVQVRAIDEAGNTSETGVSELVLADRSPADPASVATASRFVAETSRLTATATAADGHSDIASFALALGTSAGASDVAAWRTVDAPGDAVVGNPDTFQAGVQRQTAYTFEGLSLLAGVEYYVALRVTNGAGLVRAVASGSVMVDATSPQAPSVSDGGTFQKDRTALPFAVAARDDESGVQALAYWAGTAAGLADLASPREVALDGGKTVSWNGAVSGLNLAHGSSYFVSAKVQDRAGHWSAVGASDGIRVDVVAPATPEVTADARVSADRGISGAYHAQDDLAATVRYEVGVGTSPLRQDVVPWREAPAAGHVSLTGLSLADGVGYYLLARATDEARNVSPAGASSKIVADTSPATPLTLDAPSFTRDPAGLGAAMSAADAHSDVVSFACALGTSPGAADVAAWRPVDASGTAAAGDPSTWQPGTTRTAQLALADLSLQRGVSYFLTMRAVNGAGLVAPLSSAAIRLDNAVPATPVVSDGGAHTALTNRLDLRVAARDEDSGIVKVRYRVGTSAGADDVAADREVAVTQAMEISWQGVATGLSLQSGGVYFVAAAVADAAGNWSPLGAADGIRVDTSAPGAPTVTDDGEVTAVSAHVHFRFEGADPESGIAAGEVALGSTAGGADIAPWQALPAAALGAHEHTVTGLSLASGKTVFVAVRLTNGAGLTGAAGTSDGILVDYTIPVVESVVDDGAFTTRRDRLSFTVHTADSGNTVRELHYALGTAAGGEDVVSSRVIENPATTEMITLDGLSLADGGAYYLTARAKNALERFSDPVSSNGITVDGSAPGLPAVDDGGAYFGDAINVTVTIADPHSGIARAEACVGATRGLCDVLTYRDCIVGTDGKITAAIADERLVPGTAYYVTARAINGAGLQSPAGSADGIRRDTTAPPAPTIVKQPAWTRSTSRIELRLRGSDLGSGISAFEVAFGRTQGATDVAAWKRLPVSGGVSGVDLEADVAYDGLLLTHGQIIYPAVRSVDGAGLKSGVITGVAIGVDTIAPSPAQAIVLAAGGAPIAHDPEVPVEWSGFVDSGPSGIAGYYFGLANGGGTTNGSYTETARGLVAAGTSKTITVYVWAADRAGNIGLAAKDAVEIDLVHPQAPWIYPEPTYTAGTKNTLQWVASCSFCSHKHLIEASQDDFASVAFSSGWLSASADSRPATSYAFTGLEDGVTYRYRVRAKDVTGDMSPWSGDRTSTQDDTAPKSGAKAIPSRTVGAIVDVPFEASDERSGLSHVELYYSRADSTGGGGGGDDDDHATWCARTQGGWGSECSGGNVGCLRDASFAAVFPQSFSVGGQYAMTFTSSQAVEAYLPAEYGPGVLTASVTNPLATPAGVLGGQVTALALNVAFSAEDLLPHPLQKPLGSRRLPDGKFAGLKVDELLGLASAVLGGNTSLLPPFGASLGDLVAAVAFVNEHDAGCDASGGAPAAFGPAEEAPSYGPFVRYPGFQRTSPIEFDTRKTGGAGLYRFYTVAVDRVGNREAAAEVAQASTEVVYEATVLVVDDDGDGASESAAVGALMHTAFVPAVWDVAATGRAPSAAELTPYRAVVWDRGLGSLNGDLASGETGLSAESQAALQGYVESGGGVVAVGSDLVAGSSAAAFIRQLFHAGATVSPDLEVVSVRGVTATALAPVNAELDAAVGDQGALPDGVAADERSAAVLKTDGGAVVGLAFGGAYRSMLLTVPVAAFALESGYPNDAASVLAAVLQWILLPDFDLNDDQVVDLLDWQVLAAELGCRAGEGCYRDDHDFNADGLVDGVDLVMLQNAMAP